MQVFRTVWVNGELNLSFVILICFSDSTVFAKAIHCLSKIGCELYLEALSEGVSKYCAVIT